MLVDINIQGLGDTEAAAKAILEHIEAIRALEAEFMGKPHATVTVKEEAVSGN